MIFLGTKEILEMHNSLIFRFGGLAGIRDKGLLESAIMHPKIIYLFGVENDPYKLAAIYAYHLIQNHPFIDGNKRVGIMSLLVFLKINGFKCNSTQENLYNIAIKVASSKATELDIYFVIVPQN